MKRASGRRSRNWRQKQKNKQCADGRRQGHRMNWLLRSHGGSCAYCGVQVTRKDGPTLATVDHLVPSSRGGTDDLANLRLACRDCNEGKGNQIGVDVGIGPDETEWEPTGLGWCHSSGFTIIRGCGREPWVAHFQGYQIMVVPPSELRAKLAVEARLPLLERLMSNAQPQGPKRSIQVIANGASTGPEILIFNVGPDGSVSLEREEDG